MDGWNVLGNLITTCVGVWLTNKYLYEKDVSKKAHRNFLEKSLTLLYLPIRKIIDKSIFPGEPYEGLDSEDVNKIVDIIVLEISRRTLLQFVE